MAPTFPEARLSASSPSWAASTRYPCPSSTLASNRRMGASSSTSKMVSVPAPLSTDDLVAGAASRGASTAGR